MTAPQSLLQAAALRLGARLGSGLVDAAANLALLAQDAPERLRQEWQLFWDEVEMEAARIERGEAADRDAPHAQPGPAQPGVTQPGSTQPGDPQEQIDALRARVAALSRRLDQRP